MHSADFQPNVFVDLIVRISMCDDFLITTAGLIPKMCVSCL